MQRNGNGTTPKTEYSIKYPKLFSPEITSYGFFKTDIDWTVKYWNRAAEKITGIPAKDLLGKNLWKEMPSALRLDLYTLYHQTMIGEHRDHQEEYLGKMGHWFDVVIYRSNDTIAVSFKSDSFSSDSQYTDDPKQQLKTLNELYRFVSEVTNDCLWEWNIQQQEFFWIDGGHRRIFGYSITDAFVPQSFWESLLHPDDKLFVLTKLSELMSRPSGETWEVEYRFKRSDGSYAYVFDRGRVLYDGHNKVLRMIGATQDVTTRKWAEKEIAEAVLLAHEEERKEIGKEMHDNLNQVLGAAKLYVEAAKTDDESRDLYLDRAIGYIMQVIEEIRKVAKTLIIPDMHYLGLIGSIRNLVHDMELSHTTKISFFQKGIVEKDLHEKLQLDIFRIIQEQLNNILKHSEATNAIIELSRHGNDILLDISDNGKGGDTSRGVGVGLINMKNRAELNQGSLNIVSKPGQGYSLAIRLDINARR